MEHELLTLAEVAATLRTNLDTARRYVRTGKLAAVKVGRRYLVRRAALAAFLAAREVTS